LLKSLAELSGAFGAELASGPVHMVSRLSRRHSRQTVCVTAESATAVSQIGSLRIVRLVGRLPVGDYGTS
jgi:hypothetical protein